MYKIIMEALKFEWDSNKNEINKKKHGLSFETAKEVFYDAFAILFDDPVTPSMNNASSLSDRSNRSKLAL